MAIATASDAELQADVLKELNWEPSIDAARIGVAAKDGVVTLSGRVSSFAEKYTAERVAKRVHGVRAVVNQIDVQIPGEELQTDDAVAAEAVHALRSNAQVPADQIKVTVDRGWITLEGQVEWQYQKEAAEGAVRFLRGVTGVINLIEVRPRLTVTEVKTKIEEALKRTAETEARGIHVEVQDGKVILTGTVQSWADKEWAELEAWGAPGVHGVENRITVEPARMTWVWGWVSLFVLLGVIVGLIAALSR